MAEQRMPQPTARGEGKAHVNIVLIHGTILFARFKLLRKWFGSRPTKWNGWLRPQSLFSKRLRRSFEGTETCLCIHRFRWTGGNSDADRNAAAQRIRRKLRSWARGTGEAKWILVAHSHGGNIAVEALGDGEAQRSVGGIVALSTPFFQISVRNLNSIITRQMYFSGFPFNFVVVLCAYLASLVVGVLFGSPLAGLLFFVAVAVNGLLYSARRWTKKRNAKLASAEQTALDLLEKERYPRLWSIPLINIETRIREAKFVIGLGRWLQRVPEVMFNGFGAVLWLAPFWAAVSPLFGLLMGEEIAKNIGMLIFTCWLLQGLLLVPAILLLWSYSQIVIGGRQMAKAFYIATRVGFLPDESWGELRVRDVRGKLQLSHSLIHEDEAIVDEVSKFARDCATDQTNMIVVERKRGSILGIE